MKMRSKLSRRMTLMGVVAFALLGVGLFPHRPANGPEKERSEDPVVRL